MKEKIENKQEFISNLKARAKEKCPQHADTIDRVKVAFGGETKKGEVTENLDINLNLGYMESRNPDEQLFLFMHEVLHIDMGHMGSMEGKDKHLWNLACDAVINAQLSQKLGLAIPSDLINMPEAKDKTAEQFYVELVALSKKGDVEVAGELGDHHNEWEERDKQMKNKKSSVQIVGVMPGLERHMERHRS